jgi:hypothetical protein
VNSNNNNKGRGNYPQEAELIHSTGWLDFFPPSEIFPSDRI